MNLEYEYDSYIRSIVADMWCGLCIDHKNLSLYIQCDVVEYGLMSAIKILESLREENED